MPNVVTIPFFLLDSPLKKEERYLHCFGADLKSAWTDLIFLKDLYQSSITSKSLNLYCNPVIRVDKSHTFKAMKLINAQQWC